MQASPVHPHQTLHPCLYGLALCTGAQSCGQREGPAPNCSTKLEHGIVQMSCSAEAFPVPLTGTKGPSPAPEKQPHTITPPPPNFTLGTMQSHKYRCPGNRQTQTRPSDARWRSAIAHSREHASTALESSGGVLYTTASHALHCTW